jgi:hypothetical protein
VFVDNGSFDGTSSDERQNTSKIDCLEVGVHQEFDLGMQDAIIVIRGPVNRVKLSFGHASGNTATHHLPITQMNINKIPIRLCTVLQRGRFDVSPCAFGG